VLNLRCLGCFGHMPTQLPNTAGCHLRENNEVITVPKAIGGTLFRTSCVLHVMLCNARGPIHVCECMLLFRSEHSIAKSLTAESLWDYLGTRFTQVIFTTSKQNLTLWRHHVVVGST
jgi:hypothetical protein